MAMTPKLLEQQKKLARIPQKDSGELSIHKKKRQSVVSTAIDLFEYQHTIPVLANRRQSQLKIRNVWTISIFIRTIVAHFPRSVKGERQ
ncbi:MAG: hypothetical protein Q4D38_07380 [Planctomycetia bacterium]|nr:hypothetical protein [Planctomycetia bacterium]